jgi:heptosyltransferase III
VRILINRTDAIGDTLLSQPLAHQLKLAYPEAVIAFVIHPRCQDLFEHHPYIDSCYTFDSRRSMPLRLSRARAIINEFRPTHYFFMGGDRLLNWMAFFMGIPFRGGLKSKWSTFFLLNKGVRQQRSIVAMHESEYNLDLLRPLKIHYKAQDLPNLGPAIHLTEKEKKESLAHFFERLQKEGKKTDAQMVFIHPGMTGHTLNWPSRNYGRLITRLERNFPERFLFIVSHTQSDEPFLQGLRDHLKFSQEPIAHERIVFFDGGLRGLRHYMGVLSQASLFIGPSTGTTHIANILGLKTIALFSPIKVQSSLRWGPFYRDPKNLKIVVPDVVCGESFTCAGQSCPYYECMSKIEVEDIIKIIPSLLE